MLKKILQLIVVLLIAAQGVMAQTVQIASVTESPGPISVQVDMLGFTGANGSVAAITLNIGFDADLMDFNGISNTQLAGTWTPNANGDVISIVYTAPTGSGYDINGKAFDLLFTYKGGFSGDLVFDESTCEIANSSLGQITPVTYVNGSVTQSAAVGTVSMTTVTDTIGNTVSMPVTMQGAGFTSVSSFTFVVQYDDTELSYSGVTGAVVTGLTANANNGELTIEWTGTAADFSAATHLFDIEFVYNWGDADVQFAPGCEVDDAALAPLAVDYTDGLINSVSATRSLTIQNVAATTDTIATPVNVPVMAAGFTGDLVGAITLKFSYDDSKLTYTGYTAQQLSGWTVNSSTSGMVTFQWSSMTGFALTDGNLITLNFNMDPSGGVADVAFAGGTIIKDNNSVTIPTAFTDGSVAGDVSVTGQLTYNGDVTRPICTKNSSVTTVYLKNVADSTIAYTTTADTIGNFVFDAVAVGDYFLDASSSISATLAYDIDDALVVYDYVNGLATLTGLEFQAGDAAYNSLVDIDDAFVIYDAVIASNDKTGTGWTAPDWIFENPVVNVTSSSVVQDFSGIASGDATGSFILVP